MNKLLTTFVLLLYTGLYCLAQVPMTGAGKGAPGGSVTYSGPGDVISGATMFWSCSRVYNLAAASTSTNLCDLVAVTGGAAVCTLRGSSAGTVDLSAYCSGSTPSAACAAASGGSCKVTKFYDQTGNGHVCTQATLANMPAIVFSSQNGLPGVTFTRSSSQDCQAAAISLTAPYTVSWVGQRSSATDGSFTGMFGWNASQYFQTANTSYLFNGSSSTTVSFTDNTNFAVMDLFNGATSAMYTNGSVLSSSLVIGTTVETNGNPFALGCGNGCSDFLGGTVYEFMVWNSNQTASASSLSTEQRNASYGYNF